MRLPLKEPVFGKYLYVSMDNIIHVLMPVVSGTHIGLDNTCKAVYSLQTFFGKGAQSNQKESLKEALLGYKKALESDLSLLGEGMALLTQQKKERLSQINAYLEVVNQLEKHPELHCLDAGFPSYPRPLEGLMQDREGSNLYSMVLRPTEQDGYLRSEAANPTFSVAHRSVARGIGDAISPLQQALIQAYGKLRYEAIDSKSQVIQQTLAQIKPVTMPVNFEGLRNTLKQAVEAVLDISVDFSKTQQGEPINQTNIDDWMAFNPQDTTPKEYIDALLGYCAPNLFDTVLESPFNSLTNREAWSIATQFLLGITNIYCVTHDKISADTNWGQILDGKPDLSINLAQTLSGAQQNNQPIEDACLSWVNAHKEQLKLKTSLTQDDFKAIKAIFAERYVQIKAFPHFDEFFLLDTEKKGHFFIHQGHIGTSFAKFASSPLFCLSQALIQSLKKACESTSTLNTDIPHQNLLVKGEVEINTQILDDTGLQALYEQINDYEDLKLKKALLAQLKEERPDFKPQIDVKEFLQHIAYGEQDKAEALLQKDPDIVQALLRTPGIFTDYSGRTFNCTAYEYAYWAKDAHMIKMLEKYIFQDEETRLFILERVNAIEELVNRPQTATHFKAPPKPRGLHYTTCNEQGNTIEHWEAHFDFTPLKEAYKRYLDGYNVWAATSNWAATKAAWIAVGKAQRDVPAHVAQEYCRPDRPFYPCPTFNEPTLPRSLTFNNLDTTWQEEAWFPLTSSNSGLGFDFGLLRTGGGVARSSKGWRPGRWGVRHAEKIWADLAAISRLDEVRTADITLVRVHLNAPAPSPGL